MKKFILPAVLGSFLVSILTFVSCSKEVQSKSNYIFKPAPRNGIVAKILGKEITEHELYAGYESDIYEAEMKVYQMKLGRLKAFALEKVMNSDKRKKGLTNDEFLEKYIVSSVEISKKDISDFVKKRKIPQKHLNDQMNERIISFLKIDKKKEAVDIWMAKQTKKNPIEVYLKKPAQPIFDVTVGKSPFAGDANAKVTVVEFSDFQCPFCAKGASILTELKKKYGKKVKVVFKNFPLPFHNHAQIAAEAAMCANAQGVKYFWKMHDLMFADQTKLDSKSLKKTAKSIGLNTEKFGSCLDTNKMKYAVTKDMEDGKKAGVKSTPTFFVNGKMINGAQPMAIFSELIDSELKK